LRQTIILLIFILSIPIVTFAQNQDLQIGSGVNQLKNYLGGAYYDYSDPHEVNIKVAVWGYVRYPGKFIIPAYSSVQDLLSYAGGPTDETHLDELRLIRSNSDSTKTIIKINYKDFLFDKDVTSIDKTTQLKAGDVLLASGAPRFYLKDYLSYILSIASLLISFTILIRQK